MLDLQLTENQFDPIAYWTKPMAKLVYMPCAEDLDLFDQNGYDLTVVEQHYMTNNVSHHRNRWHHCLKQDWIVQTPKINGAVLNHSLLFERKGYQGPALDQLKHWAKSLPLLYKVISIRPKWGLDFSMDYVDTAGNAFEVLHWEWDGFEYNQVQDRKLRYQDQLISIDWDDAAQHLLKHKDDWHHLDFFEQSDWKCKYFGIEKERFKMVIWQ